MRLRTALRVLVDPGLLRYHVQRRLRRDPSRKQIAKFLARHVGRRTFAGNSPFLPEKVESGARDLAGQGYSRLGSVLDRAQIAQIRETIQPWKCFDAYDHRGGPDFILRDAPPTCNAAYYRWEDIVQIDSLLRIANDPVLLSIAQRFLGGTPTISDLRMWWSLVDRPVGKENQLFHRDADDFKFCKLFIYLTDVGPEDGPHVFVPGTSGSTQCLKDRRYADEEVASAFPRKDWVTFEGEQGNAFMADTYGLHKGLMPMRHPRLIFVAQYSLLPIGNLQYKPVRAGGSRYHAFDPYVNRLFLRLT